MSTDSKMHPRALRLVRGAAHGGRTRREPRQPRLFVDVEPSKSVLLLDMRAVSGASFADTLRKHQPRWVLDLRSLPNFDQTPLTRRAVFAMFERLAVHYRDLGGTEEYRRSRETPFAARAASLLIANVIRKIETGPVLLLLDDRATLRSMATSLDESLEGGWRAHVLYEAPMDTPP